LTENKKYFTLITSKLGQLKKQVEIPVLECMESTRITYFFCKKSILNISGSA
jgi:hypothetical protein